MFTVFLKAMDGSKYPETLKALSDIPIPAIVAYVVFLNIAACVYEYVAEQSYSSVLTLSAISHCLGMVLLCIQAFSKGAGGISAKALILDALSASLRLSSTLIYQGYLPSDATGDGVYQFFDICSLFLCFVLLYTVLVSQRCSYEECDDTMTMTPMVLGCFVLGALLHGDMNSRPIPDTLWMTGLFVGVIAVLPQYWLITKSGGRATTLTAHYILNMAVGRVLSGMFMWHVREHITCVPWVGNFEHAMAAIFLAHAIHLILLSDFAYYYLRSMVSKSDRSQQGLLIPQQGMLI